MQVEVIYPLTEDGIAYQPGDVFQTTPSRGWRLHDLGVVKAPMPWEYEYRDEWGDLRKLIGARPEGIVQFATRRRRLDELRPGEKLMVIRKYGGLGDILISSLLFPDLRDQYPDIRVTYAPPKQYHPLFAGTGLELVAYEDVWTQSTEYHRGNVRGEVCEAYDLIEDISYPCHVWENLFVAYGGVDGNDGIRWRNRLDMWANWIGLTIKNARTIIRLTEDERAAGRKRLQAEGTGKPHLLFAPISAARSKNFPWIVEMLQALNQDYTVHLIHSERLPLSGPQVAGLGLREMGAVCAAADLILSVDTSVFHWGGILGRPSIGIFNVNDGATYCKYYPTARWVQTCDTPCINVKYRNCAKHYTGNLPVIPGLGLEVSRCFSPESVLQIVEEVNSESGGEKSRSARYCA